MMSITPEIKPSPWHPGELAMQEKYGVQDQMQAVGQLAIRDRLTAQHRAFFARLPLVAIGTVDDHGDAWATFAFGRPGFLQVTNEKTLHIDASADPQDPASPGLYQHAAIGLLGIELQTRRRNRLNGRVSHISEQGFAIEVAQSFGNCPQYIQLREGEFARDPGVFSPVKRQQSEQLTARGRTMIATADTFFVASYTGDGDLRQVDVSHRGGKAGFVRIDEQGGLTVPDFAGNRFFATLGNFLVNPRAGLLFVDFASGDLLQMTGQVSLDLESAEIALFEGAERLWHFTPQQILYRAEAMPLRWRPAPVN